MWNVGCWYVKEGLKGPSLTSKGVENKLMRRWLVVVRLETRVELTQVRVGLGLGLLGGMRLLWTPV